MTPQDIDFVHENLSYVMAQYTRHLALQDMFVQFQQNWLNNNLAMLGVWMKTGLTDDRDDWYVDCSSW